MPLHSLSPASTQCWTVGAQAGVLPPGQALGRKPHERSTHTVPDQGGRTSGRSPHLSTRQAVLGESIITQAKWKLQKGQLNFMPGWTQFNTKQHIEVLYDLDLFCTDNFVVFLFFSKVQIDQHLKFIVQNKKQIHANARVRNLLYN